MEQCFLNEARCRTGSYPVPFRSGMLIWKVDAMLERRREVVVADSRPPSDMAPSASSTISMQIFNAIRLGALHLTPMCCLSYREACEYCMQRCNGTDADVVSTIADTKLGHISSDDADAASVSGASLHLKMEILSITCYTLFRLCW